MLTIRGGTVVDPVLGNHILDAAVIIDGARIISVGPSDAREANESGQTIDARGKWLIPGLIDSHTHISVPDEEESPAAAHADRTHESLGLSALYALNNAQELLAAGVTTVRDVGAHGLSIFAVQRLIEAGVASGARIVAAGEAIAMTGGHFLFGSTQADGPDAIRRLARRQLTAGAGVIKLMGSGGAISATESPYDVHFSEEELSAGIEEAHARGKPAAVHAHNSEAARRAVRSGADTIEHGVFLDDEALDLMREHEVALVPTHWAFRRIAEHGLELGFKQPVIDVVRDTCERHITVIGHAHAAGVTILAGTDSTHPFNPARSLHAEMAWLAEAGLSPLEALRAATSDAAEKLRLDAQLGTISVGKSADLVILDADPTENIRNVGRVDTVIFGGAIAVRAGRLLERGLRDPRPVPVGTLPAGPRG